MTNPKEKRSINKTEIRKDLEERIRETEENIELASLVNAWCKVTKRDNEPETPPPDLQASMIVKETVINIILIIVGGCFGAWILKIIALL